MAASNKDLAPIQLTNVKVTEMQNNAEVTDSLLHRTPLHRTINAFYVVQPVDRNEKLQTSKLEY